MMDLLLRGGTVVDGTGAPGRRADVGVTGDRIVSTCVGATAAREVVDVTGLVVTPGFVDLHTHSDVSLLHDPRGESKVLQGVTTEVVGNCGFSAFPVADRSQLADHLARLGDDPVRPDWDDLDGYARQLEVRPPALNVAALVGHGALRIAAMADPYRAATGAEVRAMAGLLDRALAQGAFGLSSGLTHTPSSHGEPGELEALAARCAVRGAVYATHARAGAGRELAALDEALATARRSGVRLQFSHLALNEPANWGRAGEALERFEQAVGQGLDAAFDVYPYDASSSTLLQYLPEWVQAGGGPGLRRNAADPAWRRLALADIAHGWFGGIPWHWERVTVAAAPGAEEAVGRSLAELAEAWERPPEEVLLDLCVELGSAAQAVLHYRQEEDMRAFLAHPLSVVGSDGNALPLAPARDRPHPRSFGTFPRVLGPYVRDHALLGLPAAVHKMTQAPARRLGLHDRGVVREGAVADLVVLDPGTVADQATFAAPRRAPRGIVRTVVAGRTVARDGVVLAERPGRFLRRG